MEVAKISLQEYLAFYKSIYRNDPSFKDNKTGLCKLVCGKGRPFHANSKQALVAIKESGQMLCACALIIHKNAAQMLSVAFFEALPGCQSAVDMLMEYASDFGRQHGCAQLVVSLDGHVNNNVAFPCSGGQPSFGASYSPAYYHDYFEGFARVKFTSFCDDIALVNARIAADLPRLAGVKQQVTLEHASFGSRFGDTMRRYTDLNNAIFADHRYYFDREYSEDRDLFADMRPLLKKQNLIFATCAGKDIGFILWYPDFNDYVQVGRGASVLTFIKYRVLRLPPKTAKVVEIGVLPQYRHFGTILLLFHAAIQSTAKSTQKILSSWILDENTRSKAITQRYTQTHYKDYYAYEKEL